MKLQEVSTLLNKFIYKNNVRSDSMDGVKMYTEGHVVLFLEKFADQIKRALLKEKRNKRKCEECGRSNMPLYDWDGEALCAGCLPEVSDHY